MESIQKPFTIYRGEQYALVAEHAGAAARIGVALIVNGEQHFVGWRGSPEADHNILNALEDLGAQVLQEGEASLERTRQ